MRSRIVLVVFACVFAGALRAGSSSISGRWNVHSNFSGNVSDSVCTFVQNEKELTGTCKTDRGEGKAAGKVDGTKVVWVYHSEYNGSPITLSYAGKLDPGTNQITGTASVEEMGVDGEFTATLTK